MFVLATVGEGNFSGIQFGDLIFYGFDVSGHDGFRLQGLGESILSGGVVFT